MQQGRITEEEAIQRKLIAPSRRGVSSPWLEKALASQQGAQA